MDRFEALCIEADSKNKESENVLIITYPSLEKWNEIGIDIMI